MRSSFKRTFSFGFVDERNNTSNVKNSRRTFSAIWSELWSEKLKTVLGFDHRRFNDELTERVVDSNLGDSGGRIPADQQDRFSQARAKPG